jgi:hypothetical protein
VQSWLRRERYKLAAGPTTLRERIGLFDGLTVTALIGPVPSAGGAPAALAVSLTVDAVVYAVPLRLRY